MKILAYIQSFDDGVNLYRGQGVLSELHKLDSSVHITYAKDFDIRKHKGYDVCFMLHPFMPSHVDVAKNVKRAGIKLVLDYDDNYFEIPKHNQFHRACLIKHIDYVTNIKACIAEADSIIVSNIAMKYAVLKHTNYTNKIEIVENAFDDYMNKRRPPSANTWSKNIVWRGGKSRISDLEANKGKIEYMIRNHDNFNYIFWCNFVDIMPKWLHQLSKETNKIKFKREVHAYNYWHELVNLAPYGIMYLNESNSFNTCRSDINRLEAYFAGCVMPSNETYEDRVLSKINNKRLEVFKNG